MPRRPLVDLLWLAAILALAVGLRLSYVHQLQASPFFSRYVMDPLYHHQWAQSVAAGTESGFVPGAYFRAPLYPWTLGVLYRVFGESPMVPRIFGTIVGALSCALLYLIGRRTFGRAVGAIAGLAAAGYPMLLYFDAELKVEGLAMLLNLALLGLLLAAHDRPSWWRWGLCGALLGLAAITRPNILLLAPVLAGWVVWLNWRAWRAALGHGLALTAGTLLPILPVTIRNVVVGGDFALIATSGGVNFYIGNNPGSDGMSAVIPGDPPAWWPCYHAQIERAERAEGRTLRGSEVSRWYARQAWHWIAENPGAALALTLRKLGYFWSHWEVSNNQDIQFVFTKYATITRWLPVRFWLAAPLGILGLCLCLRRARELFPLWSFVLVYMVSVVVFFVSARYRIPVAPVLILFAAHACVWIARSAAALRWMPLLAAAAPAALMGYVVSRTPPGLDTEMIQGHVAAGMFLAADGKLDEAEPLLSEAVLRAQRTGWRLQPEVPEMLAHARMKRGDFAGAASALRIAVQADPKNVPFRQALGVALAGAGDLEAAATEFRAALDLRPDDPALQANLGNALAQGGRVADGLPLMLEAARADRKYLDTLRSAADALLRRGNQKAGLRVLEGALEVDPDDLGVLSMLIQLRVVAKGGVRDPQEATRLAERALTISRGEDAFILHVAAGAFEAAGDLARARDLAEQGLRRARSQGRDELARELERVLRRLERGSPQPP